MSDRKDVQGKPDVLSFPYAALKAWNARREYGRQKYGNCNTWMEGEPLSQYWKYLNAAARHAHAIEEDGDIDPENNEPHVWSALWSAAAACWHYAKAGFPRRKVSEIAELSGEVVT